MTSTNELYDKYAEHVQQAARSVARGSAHMGADDLEQMLWVWLLEDGHKYLSKKKQGEVNVGAVLTGAAKRISMRELNSWREFQGNYTYQPKEVRRLLGEAGDGEKSDLEGHLDLEKGMTKLEAMAPGYHAAILQQYFLDVKMDGAGRKRVSRGVDMLTSILNNDTKNTRQQIDLDEASLTI